MDLVKSMGRIKVLVVAFVWTSTTVERELKIEDDVGLN